MMNLFRRLRVWWSDLSYPAETQEWIDDFLGVYTASGGPSPMDRRRDGETMREYRARFVEWLTAPRTYPNWASDQPITPSNRRICSQLRR
jgi:hypothetical protein